MKELTEEQLRLRAEKQKEYAANYRKSVKYAEKMARYWQEQVIIRKALEDKK